MSEQNVESKPAKPVRDRAGHVYKSQAEKMKFYMRRKRGAPLPGFPVPDKKVEG
jgi:hypothetical protein